MSRAIAAHHGAFGRAAVLELDHSMPMHAHREGHLIFYVSGPPSTLFVAGDEYSVGPNTAVAISPLLPHRFQVGLGDQNIVTLTLYIDPQWFRQSADSLLPALRFGRPGISVDPAMQSELMALYTQLCEGETRATLDRALYQLTERCFRESWRAHGGLSAHVHEQRALDNRIRKSITLMADHVASDLNIDTIAREAGLSRPHFYRLFRENIGVTPNVYLNTLRAEAAIERLTTTDQAVTSIGLDLGFASQASFTRFFRANVGIPPTNYRQVAMFA